MVAAAVMAAATAMAEAATAATAAEATVVEVTMAAVATAVAAAGATVVAAMVEEPMAVDTQRPGRGLAPKPRNGTWRPPSRTHQSSSLAEPEAACAPASGPCR